jgi:hypothetical protein
MSNSKKEQVLEHISLACAQITLGVDLAKLKPAEFGAQEAGLLANALAEVLIHARTLETLLESRAKTFTELADYDDVHDGETEPGAEPSEK